MRGFQIHGFGTPKIQDGFGPNPNPNLLTYPNKGFGFGPPQIQIHVIQTKMDLFNWVIGWV